MVEDNSSTNQRRLDARLDELEQLLRMQTTRLHAIEQRLGIDFQPPHVQRAASAPEPARDSFVPTAQTTEAHAAPPPTSRPHADDVQATQHESDATQVEEDDEAARGARQGQGASGRASDSRGWASVGGGVGGARTENRSGAESAAGGSNAGAGGGGAGGSGAASSAAATTAEKPWFDLESHIGGSWFNWIGILAIAFGVAFFLKYAFDNEWIGPRMRVTLGAVAGLGILALADRLRVRGLRQYAYVLSGGGIMILYLSVFAAFSFYHLIGQVPAFVLMAGVTALAVLLSARHDALPIAILGLVGGFLTPLLLSTGRDNEVALFGYITLLDAGVLTLAYFKQWRSLNHLSFVATVMMTLGWMMAYYATEKLWLTIFFLTLFFVLFSFLAIAHNVLRQRPARWPDISLIITNATFYFTLVYNLLDQANYDRLLGSFALIVSTFYVLLYYAAHKRHRADRLLIYSLLGAAITFFTMAVAIQLDQQWVTIAWAVEAVVLTWVGLRSETNAPRHAALVVFMVAVAHWFGQDVWDFAYRSGGSFVPLLNARAASCAVLVAACAANLWFYQQPDALRRIKDDERAIISTVFMLAANFLVLTLLTFDIDDYFEQRRASLFAGQGGSLGQSQLDEAARLKNTQQFVLTSTWTLYATAALVLGVVRRLKPLRVLALVVLALTMIKAVSLDVSYYDAAWHTPVFNQTFFSLMLLVAALALGARVYGQSDGRVGAGERGVVVPLLIVAANLLALLALSAEATGHFDRAIRRLSLSQPFDLPAVEQLQNNRLFALSVIWAIYGGAMLTYGHLRGNRMLRVMALVLLGVTTLKVFFLDLASLDVLSRIVSFIVLGLILLAVSYLYQRRRQQQQQTAEAEGGG